MKTKTHFQFRIDLWDASGETLLEHVAGVDDFALAEATYHTAVVHWPAARIMLRQGARVIHDTGQRQRKNDGSMSRVGWFMGRASLRRNRSPFS